MEEKTLTSLSRLDIDGDGEPLSPGKTYKDTWWTDEDIENPENMFLVENKDGNTMFLFVKDNKIHEKDCVTGDVYGVHDLTVINNIILPETGSDCLEIQLSFETRMKSMKEETSYTFEDEQSFNSFKDQFIQPIMNSRAKQSNQPGVLPRKEFGRSYLEKIYKYVEKLPSVRLVSQEKSNSSFRQSTEKGVQGGGWWTKEDVENPEDMYLVENKDGKTVFLFVKDNIIHEKDTVSGDVWVNHDLAVLTNAVFPESGSKNLEIKLSFDSRVQNKKEARYSFENQKTFNAFKDQFVKPALNRRVKQSMQGRRRFECLKCAFSEIANQSHEKDNTCPQCSSGFTFFTNIH